MDSKNKFAVKAPQFVIKLCIFLFVFLIGIVILTAVTSGPSKPEIYVIGFLMTMLPLILVMRWCIRFKIAVDGDMITVTRANGKKRSFHISEIRQIDWKIATSRFIRNENVIVRMDVRQFSFGTVNIGFERMAAYLKENVEPEKIKVHNIDFT